MEILIIDNYDSFTQNLVQYIGHMGFSVKVVRNDEVSIDYIDAVKPGYIILSPGPGKPQDAGLLLDLVNSYAGKIPILGVCLGHQAIGYAYGAMLYQLNKPVHGKISKIWHNNDKLFHNLPNPFYAARYHSLVLDSKNFPSDLEVIAWTEDGTVMACKHKTYNYLIGVQFHPESIWTQNGNLIIQNFLSIS